MTSTSRDHEPVMPSPPEPDLTPKELVARAVALRPKVMLPGGA
jgi:hypothetical protein